MESITTKEIILSNGQYSWKICFAPNGPNLVIALKNEKGEWEYNNTFQTVTNFFPGSRLILQ